MSFEKFLALSFSLMILGQAYLVRRVVGTWLFPACLFGLFWFGYTFVPLATLFWVPVQPYATAFIFFCALTFSIGSLPFDWKTAFDENARKGDTVTRTYGSPFLKVVFFVSTLSSVVFLALNSFVQGFALRDLVFDLFASAAAYAELRYTEGLNNNIYGSLSIIFTYLGVILGGLLFPSARTKGWRRLIIVLSFLPSILVALTQSAKGLLFLCAAFFYAGLLVYRASAGSLRLFEKGSLKATALCGVLLILIVTIAFVAGGLYQLEDTGATINQLIPRFASYSCGHLYAFSDWFAFALGTHSEFSYPDESAAHGFYTFMALFKLVGSNKEVSLGIYDEYYSYEDLLGTNIYTMFRGLILDFGFVGSVLLIAGAGFLVHWAFCAMLRNRRPVFTVVVFVFMTGYFYMSYIISFLIWNSIYLTFVLVWIVLQINKLIWLAPSAVPIGAAARFR